MESVVGSLVGLLGLRPRHPTAIQLQGPRIVLRHPRPRDWAAWAHLRAESRAFLAPWEPTWPSDALTRGPFRRRVRRQMEEWREDTTYSFLLFRRSDNALLGGIGLTNVRRGVAQSASLGYWVGHQYARCGYMTEAVSCVLDFAFDTLQLHRVEAACLPSNEASRRLLLKAGFQQEGYARAYLRIDGAWRDHMLFAILREDKRLPSSSEGVKTI